MMGDDASDKYLQSLFGHAEYIGVGVYFHCFSEAVLSSHTRRAKDHSQAVQRIKVYGRGL